MNLREAAQQALEALEIAMKTPIDEYLPRECLEAIDALRAALANTQDWDEVEALRESLREHMAEIHRLRAAGRQALDAMDALHRTGDTQVLDMYGREATEALRATLSWDAMQRLTYVKQEIEQSVTDCHEKEGDKLSPPSDHVPDATKMMASVREDRTVEPVRWMVDDVVFKNPHTAILTAGMLNKTVEPLYAAPPKREPLTEEEIQSLADEFLDWNLAGIESFARAIERAHGIGGEE